MKTYDITVMGLTRGQVMDVIERVPSGRPFRCSVKDDDVEPAPKKKKVIANGQLLKLTGKRATAGSIREKMLLTMERLEKKHGIGTVTRQMLRDECNRKGIDSQILYQLVREGYLDKA